MILNIDDLIQIILKQINFIGPLTSISIGEFITHTHTHTHTQIFFFLIIYKNCCKKKEAVLLPIKSSSDIDPEFRHGFGAEASLPLSQGTPAASHNTTGLYQIVFDQYECIQGSLKISKSHSERKSIAEHF